MDHNTVEFRDVIENVLNRWTGLKMAVDHQAGGRNSLYKALDLIDSLTQLFEEDSSIEPEDLENIIAEYMDNEFQTLFEDDSIKEITTTLLRLHAVPPHQALAEMNQLPSCQSWLEQPTATTNNATNNVHIQIQDSSDEEDEIMRTVDEWTTVSYKKKG